MARNERSWLLWCCDKSNTIKRLGWITGLFLLVLSLGGCFGARKPIKGFSKEPVFGVFGGEDWQYVYGYIDPTAETPGDEDYLLILLPFKPKDQCPKAAIDADDNVIMAAIPLRKKPVRLKRGSKRTLTFSTVVKGKPRFKQAKKGRLEITKLGKARIEGRLYGLVDNDHWVSGRFQAVRCSFSDMQTSEPPW